MRGLVVGARRSLTGVVRGKRSLHGSSCQVHYPPAILEAPYFERPTPVLLAHGECLRASVWTSLVSYLTERGCTVGVLEYGPGFSRASLEALEGALVGGTRRLSAGPPVIIAHSIMGFVAQKFLESHAARGLILLNPFPPSPAERVAWYTQALQDRQAASRLLARGDGSQPSCLDMDAIPWEAMSEMRKPESAVRLEPGSVPMLLLRSCQDQPVIGEEEVRTTAAFHAVPEEDVRVLANWTSHMPPVNGEGRKELAGTVYEWYNELF